MNAVTETIVALTRETRVATELLSEALTALPQHTNPKPGTTPCNCLTCRIKDHLEDKRTWTSRSP